MYKGFKYRIYPNKTQVGELETMLETHRRLYNQCLEIRNSTYQEIGKGIRYSDQSAWYNAQRSENPYFARLNFTSAQATMRRLDKAFQNFFRRVKAGDTPGYPRFKGRNRFNSIDFASYGDGCKIKQGQLYLQCVGKLQVKWHRPIEGEVKSLVIRREADQWYVSFRCQLLAAEKPPINNKAVGIDVGLNSFYATSTGDFKANPRFLKKSLTELRVASRSVARKVRGSVSRKKAVHQLQKVHRKVRNQRKDFHHKSARELTDNYGFIAAESLNIKGMVRNRRLSRSIQDAGWGQFLSILAYQAESAGGKYVEVPAHYTSQKCSGCGEMVRKSLSVRTHRCSCGIVLDRDVNASLNILSLGLGQSPESLTWDIGSCVGSEAALL